MPNNEKEKPIRSHSRASRALDDLDRKILGALARQADQSYARLAERVGLSPPAAHERVKRLRAAGVIRAIEARLDGEAVGKPLLAFIHVVVNGWGKSRAIAAIAALPEVEELHSVTGDSCLILKARFADAKALEGLLAQLYAAPGVQGTKTSIALSTLVERGVQAEITEALASIEPFAPPRLRED